eukprot:TRINITY_DN6739_c0_g1_i3.p1 TRINITY_DN6739_c0_g1~~TRINITY_DN6739_c0_g1_i3.p1  ORF type:complete len:111 (+),score=21.02 TRINITY_DN6739_c0_g1_i3:77-409(+)
MGYTVLVRDHELTISISSDQTIQELLDAVQSEAKKHENLRNVVITKLKANSALLDEDDIIEDLIDTSDLIIAEIKDTGIKGDYSEKVVEVFTVSRPFFPVGTDACGPQGR